MATTAPLQPEAPQQAPTQAVGPSEAEAKAYIYQHESGNDPYAVNPTSGACGLGQSLPCEKMGCELGDYACQDTWATNYMLDKYGSWFAAMIFHQNNNYW